MNAQEKQLIVITYWKIGFSASSLRTIKAT